MTAKTTTDITPEAPKKRNPGPRVTHVLYEPADKRFADVENFGQELDALRALTGRPGWRYAKLNAGQSLLEHIAESEA